MKKLLAFTLAETLVVIGIIGIVSALTLPNLNGSTGEKEKIAKVRKLYQNFDEAITCASVIYGPIDEWFLLNDSIESQLSRGGGRITEFMKVSKHCGVGSTEGCFKMPYKTLSGRTYGSYDDLSYSFVLPDGTSVILSSYDYVIDIMVDIDGPNKGSNTYGKDIFSFRINARRSNLLRPNCSDDTFSNILKDLTSGDGYCAAYWVINYDNMDYLKLDSSGKCPNGSTPIESNPRCN